MKSLFRLTLIATLGALLMPMTGNAQKRKLYSNDPIKVVKIDRKEPIVFQKDVWPILKKKCAFCHSGNVVEGQFDMGTFEGLMKGGKKGKPVVPKNAEKSLLYGAAGKTMSPKMPPRREEPLTPEELAVVKLWIDQGAKAPTGPLESATVVVNLPPETVKPVRAVAISPDKKKVIASRGNELHVYDGEKGEYLRAMVDPTVVTSEGMPAQVAHLTLIESMAYSPDGKIVATGSFREVKLWDPETGTVQKKLEGFVDRVVALAFSPDGKLLATGGGMPTDDGEIKVFDVASGKLVTDIKGGHSDQVFGVCFSPDSKMIATCGADKFVKVFEVPSGKFVKSFEGHTHHVMDVGWNQDGKTLASAGADNVVKIWDFEKGEQQKSVNAHQKQVTRLMFVGKTRNFITCSGDKAVALWDSANGRRIRNFSAMKDFVYAVSVSPDGKLIAAGGEEGIVRLYNDRGAVIKDMVPPEPKAGGEKEEKAPEKKK